MLPEFDIQPKSQRIKPALVFTAVSAFVFVLLGIFGLLFIKNESSFKSAEAGFEKFKSEEEIRDYFASATRGYGIPMFGGGVARDLAFSTATQEALPSTATDTKRVSETNVQVGGIDEPDVVKTDGTNIYFSSQNFVYFDTPVKPLVLDRGTESIAVPPIYQEPKTKVVSALPPNTIALASEIDANGELMLADSKLLVFSYDRVKAFDISDPDNPVIAWENKFDENFNYQTARKLDGNIYLVLRRYTGFDFPCPMPLYQSGLSIACTDIYRPGQPIATDSVYSILKIDPKNGNSQASVTFVGSNDSVVYMSPSAIYTTFTMYPNMIEFTASFLSENQDLIPQNIALRINNLIALDISQESKNNELNIIVQRYLTTLSNDERTRVENELTNRMNTYLASHGRELQKTKVVKIDTNLNISATSDVPGAPINQFSLDEFNGELRIATTLSASTMFGSGESTNDLYVLGGDLSIKGSLQGLAKGERIYSARFIDDKAYLVTFKQIDPFFVIDLSDSSNPKVAGELKIPGFSSYLHPLAKNMILGVGQEDSRVKLSVFNVSDPTNPVEVEKYLLDEYWTDVATTHHAFLHDPEHKVFFMPAGQNGFVFGYEGSLTLKKAISDLNARRALYIGDNMYIVGDQEIVVLNEVNWEEVSNLEF